MTKEEVKTLESLYDKFLAKCEKICKELDRLDGDYSHCDKFIPMADDVIYCCGHEEHVKYFPSILLTYTEEEVKSCVDALLTFAKREREKKERLEKEKNEKN